MLKSYLSNPSQIFTIEEMEAVLWLIKQVYFFHSLDDILQSQVKLCHDILVKIKAAEKGVRLRQKISMSYRRYYTNKYTKISQARASSKC